MGPPWLTRTVLGIVLATFFSDVGHEMMTAVLPLYLGSIGLGAGALGVMEGAADLAFSLSKLAGGAVGHRVEHKRPWMIGGYFVTALGTGAIALVRGVVPVTVLRTVAWIGRGFRGPMRDFLLADEVEPTHFGRAYGVERTADMLGAVLGPFIAFVLVWAGVSVRNVILVSIIPSLFSVASVVSMVRDRPIPADAPPGGTSTLPRKYWWFVGGVLLFGLGDFSRTFLILLAATAFGDHHQHAFSIAVLVYAGHNLVSAFAAYPAGRLGDAFSKSSVLVGGYALGVVTNVVLAVSGATLPWLVVAVVLSAVYIAVEDTLEKAVIAGLLPRDRRSLGLGILASANALGDFGSSIFVGAMLSTGHVTAAFTGPAVVGACGVVWLLVLKKRATI